MMVGTSKDGKIFMHKAENGQKNRKRQGRKDNKQPQEKCGLQARAVLMGQWGFGKNGDLAGTVCLFTGEPGTGKTLAAEAVGFETGKPLKARDFCATHHMPIMLIIEQQRLISRLKVRD